MRKGVQNLTVDMGAHYLIMSHKGLEDEKMSGNQGNRSNEGDAPSPFVREKVLRLHSLYPNMSGAEIARQTGCSRERVRKILGTGSLKRAEAVSTIHIHLGEELRAEIGKAAEGHKSISGWCQSILKLACSLQSMGVDPVVVLEMKAKEVEEVR